MQANALTGLQLWQSALAGSHGCGGCHDAFPAVDTPDDRRRNTGNTRAVLDKAIAINAGGWMGRYASTNAGDAADGAEPVNAADRNSLVAFIGGFVANATTSVNYHGTVQVTMRDMQVNSSTVLTNVTTGVPANGTLANKDITPFGPPTIDFTHTANNCNNGSFTYTGTGSASTTTRTATITINHPAAPGATGTTSSVPYSTSASAAQPLSTSGFVASVVIDSQPSVGSVAASGIGFTYTGSASQYSSPVTFTWHAVGPCGEVSSVVTQTVNVATPPAPTVTPKSQTVQSNTTTNISLTANISGVYSPPITIASGPTSGSAVVVGGTTVDYTPNTNFSGADSFTYTATGPGGTSTPATVSITVTAAPLTANKSVTVTYQTATPIDLTSSITGAFTNVSVASAPAHGTAIATGPSTITYTPAAGYFGPDSFTYTATGAGGTSTAATVNITVNPPAPTTSARSVSVSANSTTPIDLSSSISGVSTSVSVAGNPAHGSATVTGPTTITYTPTTNYIGADTFTFTAQGPGGTSNTSTVTITVNPPPPPGATPLSATVPYNTATTINTFIALTGTFTAITIVSSPLHGTATTQGTLIFYTPNAGYFGPDSLTFVGLGLGGASNTVTLSITVQPPGPPTVTARTASVPFNTAVQIDLTSAVSGVFTSVALASQPAHGTATLNGNVVTYKPANNYTGPDSFTFTATGPGGTSQPATVTLTVNTAPPIASNTTMAVALNGAGTIDLAPFISGSGITGIAIATQPAHGTAGVNGTKVTYTPAPGFFGKDTFTYIAFGDAGTSPPATITVTIIGRPDPSKDPVVGSLIDTQHETAKRFARAQLGNFQQRLEALHARGPEGEPTAAVKQPQVAMRNPTAEAFSGQGERRDPVLLASAGGTGVTGAIPSSTTESLSAALANSLMSLAASQSLSVSALNGGGPSLGFNFWVAGTLHFGNRGEAAATRFRTDGVSAGVDRRLSDRLALGVGVGFSRDKAELGEDGSRTRTTGKAVAAYGSFHPSRNTFVDALVGYASLDTDSDRFIGMMNDFARMNRGGDQWFGSLALGYEHRREGMVISPYARLDYATTRLKQGTETGGGAGALVYLEQTVPMFEAVVGLRAESQHETRFGSVRPRARIEFSHDLESERAGIIAYADDFGTRYTVTPSGGVRRNALLLGVGTDFNLGGGLKLGLDYQSRRASTTSVDQLFRIQLTQELDGRGGRWFAMPMPTFPDPVRVEAGFTYEDNVTRARTDRDKLADRIFSFSMGQGRIFPLNANTRVIANVFVSGEEMYRYSGLSRFSGGGSAELQYRASGDWDAITYGLQARGSGDYYDAENRRGYRASVTLSARKSLTDRIEAFAALTGNRRWGKSAVFDLKDYGAKVNLDYALPAPHGSIYLGGEYRRGDSVSTGRFSLESIDIADVFTPDEQAFGEGFYAYRFEAKTWIGTLGYNRPLGPRDAIDFSWRRAQSTPADRPGFTVPGAWRYIDNIYSITYLMRF